MRGVHVSSIVNEGIRAILNLFIIFLREDFTHTKSTKRIQANKNKKDTIFMSIKTSKRQKIVCLRFALFVLFMFFMRKKTSKRRKVPCLRFVFFVLFMLFLLFVLFMLSVRVKSSCKKNKEV